jgi:hypothetical protein
MLSSMDNPSQSPRSRGSPKGDLNADRNIIADVEVTFVGNAPLGVVLHTSGSPMFALMIERFTELHGVPGATATYNMSCDDQSSKVKPGMMVTHSNGVDLSGKPFTESLAIVSKMAEMRPLTLRFVDMGYCADDPLSLHFIARSGSVHLAEIVSEMHGKKLDPHAKTGSHRLLRQEEYGLDAMHLACAYGHLKMARWLADGGYHASTATGMSVQTMTVDGRTPLHIAAYHGHENIVRFIIPKIPARAVDALDARGCIPLHYAGTVMLHLSNRASRHQISHFPITQFLPGSSSAASCCCATGLTLRYRTAWARMRGC